MTFCASGTDRQFLCANYYDDYKFLDAWDTNTRQALACVSQIGYSQSFDSATGFQTGNCQALQDGSGRSPESHWRIITNKPTLQEIK